MRLAAAFFALALLPGCSSIVTGTSHTLTVNTDPQGADCELKRADSPLGRVNPTPGSLTFDKASPPVQVGCRNAAGQAGSVTVPTTVEPWVFGNIVLGGLIGAVVDLSTGATSRLPDSVTVELAPR
jgi:hypothetical protein